MGRRSTTRVNPFLENGNRKGYELRQRKHNFSRTPSVHLSADANVAPAAGGTGGDRRHDMHMSVLCEGERELRPICSDETTAFKAAGRCPQRSKTLRGCRYLHPSGVFVLCCVCRAWQVHRRQGCCQLFLLQIEKILGVSFLIHPS